MVDELKNILLAGLGSAAYTYEKSKKIVDEMVAKGKITLNEGKELSEELKRNIKGAENEVRPLTRNDMSELLKEMNFASKDDLEEIKTRLSKLEDSNRE